MEIRQATMADAAVTAEDNAALAKESEEPALEPAGARQGAEAVLRQAAKGIYFAAGQGGQAAGQSLPERLFVC